MALTDIEMALLTASLNSERILCYGVKQFARIRDNCAHLRGKTEYDPNDLRIRTEVEPYVGVLGARINRVWAFFGLFIFCCLTLGGVQKWVQPQALPNSATT